ncbi:MAG: hypothetical protein ACOX9A_04575 [Anaerolineae bacterium]
MGQSATMIGNARTIERSIPDMAQRVRQLLQQTTEMWWAVDDAERLPTGPTFTHRQQLEREKHLERLLETLTSEAQTPPVDADERAAARDRLLRAGRAFCRDAMGIQERHLNVLFSPEFLGGATGFVRATRDFDPGISGEDIFQASRNVWTMYGLQRLMGRPVELTPSVFAYSMLYPYSDNYLDDPTVPAAIKRGFNDRFSRRLMGRRIEPANAREEIISRLVGMIEQQHDRAQAPWVYEALLAIHRAQCRSMQLLHRRTAPYEVDVLGISLEKGGTSVLADGYLVSERPTPEQEMSLFAYGAFLQLVDDLQDVRGDAKDGLLTVFSHVVGHWPLDALAGRTFGFGRRVLATLDCFHGNGSEPLKELMRASADWLLVDAVGRSARYMSAHYLHQVEAYSPFRYTFLARCRRKLARQWPSLARMIESLVMPS